MAQNSRARWPDFDRSFPFIQTSVGAEILGVGPSHQALQNPLSVFRFDSGKSLPPARTVAAVMGGFRHFWAVSGDSRGCRWWGRMVGRYPGGWDAASGGGDASVARGGVWKP